MAKAKSLPGWDDIKRRLTRLEKQVATMQQEVDRVNADNAALVAKLADIAKQVADLKTQIAAGVDTTALDAALTTLEGTIAAPLSPPAPPAP